MIVNEYNEWRIYMKLANKQSLAQRSLCCGVGINDSQYIIRQYNRNGNGQEWKCPFYTKWNHMIGRCYSAESLRDKPSYIGCSVCPEWQLFSNFRLWMSNQKWEGLELDKDLLVKNNKVYSPDTCCFLPHSINSLLVGKHKKIKKNSDLPPNVLLMPSGKYKVSVWIKPKVRYIKLFSNLNEACIVALEKKIEAFQYAISYPELDVRAVFALNRDINEIQEQINNIKNSLPNLFDIG